MLFVNIARTLAADLDQAVCRDLLGADEGAVGGADAAFRQAVQPGVVHQLLGELRALVGDPAAFRRAQQLLIALGGRGAVQGAHDLEYLAGVFLVGQQLAQCAQRVTPVQLRPVWTPAGGSVDRVGHGHGREIPNSCPAKDDACVIFLQEAGAKRPEVRTQGTMATLKKRSVLLSGHATSIALEPEFWAVLDEMAAARGASLAALIVGIDRRRGERPLASACRTAALAFATRGQPGLKPYFGTGMGASGMCGASGRRGRRSSGVASAALTAIRATAPTSSRPCQAKHTNARSSIATAPAAKRTMCWRGALSWPEENGRPCPHVPHPLSRRTFVLHMF
jgi:predicted DNA-binding ribbon-helix-helix protein